MGKVPDKMAGAGFLRVCVKTVINLTSIAKSGVDHTLSYGKTHQIGSGV